ncbi:unnamed protein product [Rangifer tarandus platyrhynchus]|uniref:Uncharacterized protein n=2 Tax=Rangifer tarandus platyrhynchus TaxID=3082113 RepID=A0ACB0EE11_RANTA|nr:unnamed protein product [Rangifer tarandus platyrhynchus]CAI9698801.1 unnamed protein product [Rangifer tarandus platyrhynchus]
MSMQLGQMFPGKVKGAEDLQERGESQLTTHCSSGLQASGHREGKAFAWLQAGAVRGRADGQGLSRCISTRRAAAHTRDQLCLDAAPAVESWLPCLGVILLVLDWNRGSGLKNWRVPRKR